ncbi:uncharacterized protein G2W53_003711 [Senna tora]|uniref:Uncharacterized protein n=1 Tax=Senna tora TaxID=362788 RepID=A0A834XBP8_9FABA|nr:uncharacterized protein G2W53_003711 [Senna tora]
MVVIEFEARNPTQKFFFHLCKTHRGEVNTEIRRNNAIEGCYSIVSREILGDNVRY